jgi:hypothetical protein
MKLFIFPVIESDLDKFTEIFIIIPHLTDEFYKRVISSAGTWNEGLYSKLRFITSKFNFTKDINECDVAIIPFKYDKGDARIIEYCRQAESSNKSVICFFNDDTSEVFNLPANLYLFRTSIIGSLKQYNERCLPAIIPDHFPCYVELRETPENRTLTFCGYIENRRRSVIENILLAYNDTSFILRNGFFAPEIKSKQKARQTFYENLLAGSFALCMRGNGNFSYRFYEALSFGRIPVLIDTDCILPFSNIINWSDHIIKISANELSDIPDLIESSTISPFQNRKLWQTYFSPEGYYNNFIKDL